MVSARQIQQNVVVEGRPVLTAARAASWLGHCLLKRPAVVRIGRDGPSMRLAPRLRAYGSTSLYMKRLEYEPELALLARLVRPGDIIVDVGANFGVYSLVLASRLGGRGRVYAFEPGEAALAQLRDNCRRNPKLPVEIFPVALSHAEGDVELFHVGGAPTTFSLGSGGTQEAETVHVTTLDSWAEQSQLAGWDILKIDVEGHEPSVFRGGACSLAMFKPLVMFEVSNGALARNEFLPSEPLKLLTGLGFDIFRNNAGRLDRIEASEEGNLFAVHPQSRWPDRLRASGAFRFQ